MSKKRGTLLLLPNLLGEHKHHQPFLPASVDKAMANLDGLIAESEGGGRRFLGRFETKKAAHLMPMALLNKHTDDSDLDFLLEPVIAGERWGLVSDAGMPCIADPGHKLVSRARNQGVNIQAFVGPSAVTLALMQSGLPGQSFTFHGYLDRDVARRGESIKQIEAAAKKTRATQIVIEAPHRNGHLMESLLEVLDPKTVLCVAWNLTLPDQGLVTQPVSVWKRSDLPNLHKKPAIFLFAT